MTDSKSKLTEAELFRRELAIRELDKVYDFTLDMFKWFVTTTLALNGAALVALMGGSDLRPLITGGPGWLFVPGVILSLAAGRTIVSLTSQLGAELMGVLWRGDSLDVDSFDDFAPVAEEKKKSLVGFWLLSLSVASFLAGSVWTGVAVQDISFPKSEFHKEGC